jgi:hypothetical protein
MMDLPAKLHFAAAFAFALLVCSFGQSQATNQALPKFEDYGVPEAWAGPHAEVSLESESERLFRTQLREAAKKPADFAGHYRFAVWGCGTRCAGGAVIDLQSGEVFSPPGAGKGSGQEKWIFCTDWDKLRGAEYHVNSRLFVLRCGHQYGENQEDVQYFVWRDNRFERILVAPGMRQ